MKKLNNKGFTLVELLAVIIILAIVVGISIPAITSIINGSKSSALGVTVESAADWLEDQMTIYTVDQSAADPAFVALVTGTRPVISFSGAAVELNGATATHRTLLNAMGLTADKVTKAKVCITSAGKVAVEVTQIPTGSDYYTVENWTTAGAPNYGSDVLLNSRRGSATATPATGAVMTACS